MMDMLIVNPPAFKSNGTQFAILAMHVPNFWHDDNVDAVISKDGRRCEVTFTKPAWLFDEKAICLHDFGATKSVNH